MSRRVTGDHRARVHPPPPTVRVPWRQQTGGVPDQGIITDPCRQHTGAAWKCLRHVTYRSGYLCDPLTCRAVIGRPGVVAGAVRCPRSTCDDGVMAPVPGLPRPGFWGDTYAVLAGSYSVIQTTVFSKLPGQGSSDDMKPGTPGGGGVIVFDQVLRTRSRPVIVDPVRPARRPDGRTSAPRNRGLTWTDP